MERELRVIMESCVDWIDGELVKERGSDSVERNRVHKQPQARKENCYAIKKSSQIGTDYPIVLKTEFAVF